MSNHRGAKFNAEGYFDLPARLGSTAYYGTKPIIQAEIQKRKNAEFKGDLPKVFICSPYRGDTAANTENALRYCRFAVERGKFPVCPHVYITRFLDDDISEEREIGLSFGKRLLNECRELWLFGDKVTEGMQGEVLAAKWRGISIRKFTSELEEV
jgi:hypothetical protein